MEIETFPLEHERFLRLPEVLALIPIGKSTLWEKIRKGEFPKPIKLGPKISVWRESEVRAYMRSHYNKGEYNG